MLKFNQTRDALSTRFSHLKNLSMLKFLLRLAIKPPCFSHLKNLSMLKLEKLVFKSVFCFSHLKNLSMLKLLPNQSLI